MFTFYTKVMTEVKRLEAKAIDTIKLDFHSPVSHEMRTPLHGILSSLELLTETINSNQQNTC